MNGNQFTVAESQAIEEGERLFVYQAWPELPIKVQQSILRKAKAFATTTFPDVPPSTLGELTKNDGE
jgi:hypothetical protein